MGKIFIKFVIINIFFLIFHSTINYAQMPPHPKLLEKIKSGEQAAPYALSNLKMIRSKGVDEPWSSPGLEMQQNLKQNTFSRIIWTSSRTIR